jgi:hypothetical protein
MDKYKCVNDVFTSKQRGLFKMLPVKGKEYTLREIVVSSLDGKEGYLFEELVNDSHPNGQEYSFRPSRFVPSDEVSINSLINEKENAL